MTTITPLPPAPTRAEPDNFSIKGDAMMTALPTFVTETNAVAAEITAALDTATQAMDAAAVAVAAANFKGAWSALTGPLNIPASVSHSGKLWLLNANLANVATATPGVSGAWLEIRQIPDPTGNAGKFLTTDGTNLSFGIPDSAGSRIYAHANLGGL